MIRSKSSSFKWAISLLTVLAVMFTGLAPAHATHLRGAVGTVTYDAAAKTVTVKSLMVERKDACATYSASNSMCTFFAFPTITQVNRTTGAVVGTVAPCAGQNTTPTVKTFDGTSEPLFNIFSTTYVIDVSCPTFTTSFDYVFSQTGNNRIGGIKNSTNQTIQFEGRVSFAGTNTTPAYNTGYLTNVAYDTDVTHKFTTNLNALSQTGASVTYSLITDQTSNLGGYGSSRIPCSTFNTSTGVFELGAGLCLSGENYVTAFSGGTATTPIYYVLKTRATDAQGQYTTRDVLLQFANSTDNAPVISRSNGTSSVSLTRGATTTVTYTATDVDAGQLINWSTNTLPSWATFTRTQGGTSPQTATLTMTPPVGSADFAGTIQVSATDDAAFPLSASNSMDVQLGTSLVLPPGAPGQPIVSGAKTTTLSATFALPTTGGAATSYTLVATPIGGGTSVTGGTCLPPVSGTTQTCTIPGVLANVNYTVVVTATNASGSASSVPSAVTLPIISISQTAVTLATGTAYPTSPYTITNTGGPATYSFTGTLPAWATFSTTNGGITGTPNVATTGSGFTLVIVGTNTSTGEVSSSVSVTISVTQSLATPVITFPAVGYIYKTTTYPGSGGTADYPQYNATTGAVTGNGAPLRAVSSNSSAPIKYSTVSKPTTNTQWLTTGTPNTQYVRSTTSGTCVLYNLNGVVYVGYYYTGTSTSSKTCTVYANQDASTGWNAATQVSVTVTYNRSSWQSGSVPAPTLQNTAMVGNLGTAITPYTGTGSAAANQSFGIAYSTSTPYAATSCSVSPALPAGLTLDPQYCYITGTPTAKQALTNYTITFKNPAGTSGTTNNISITVNGRAQAITFTQAAIPSLSGNTQLAATASSGLAITYTSATTPVCTVTSTGVLTPVTSGTCTINASQNGDSTTWAAATQVAASFALGAATPVLQLTTGTSADASIPVLTAVTGIISFSETKGTATSYKLFDSNGVEVTTPPDGLAFNATTGVLSGSPEVQQTKTAYYIIAYNVNGVASNKLSFTLTILALSQTITWPSMHSMVIGQADQGIGATASSTLPVSYSTTTPTICRVNADGTLTALAAGTCTVSASQPGDGKAYLAAPTLTQNISIAASLAAPVISLSRTEVVLTVGQPFPLPFNTVNTGGTASYTISPALPSGLVFDPVYGVIGASTPRLTSARTLYTITATNIGAANAVQTATATFYLTVLGAPQTISISGSTTMTVGTTTTQTLVPVLDPNSLLAFTTITVASASSAVCSLDPATLVLTALAYGSCVINATQAGNATYSPATTSLTVAVHQAPTLVLTPSALSLSVGAAVSNPFTISTTGDPVTFQLLNSSGTNVSANTINGLTFNTATGQFTGTTTSSLSLTNYTIVAVNAYGTASRAITLTIVAATAPITLSFASGSTVTSLSLTGLTVNTATASAYTIYNTGTMATSYSVSCSPSTPIAGMSFSTTTGLYSGTPTALASAATCTITGSNSASGQASASLTLTITSSSVAVGLPLISTTAATGSGTSWTFNGSANPSGASGSPTYTFCYNTTGAVSAGALTSATCLTSNTFTSSGTKSSSAQTLAAGSIYYYQIKATNSAGTSYGNVVSVTPAAAPVVTTSASFTALTATSFQVSGTVNNNLADTTDIHICYSSTNPNGNFSSSNCPNSVVLANTLASNSAVTVTGVLTGLSSGTTYYYQVVATNATGTTYGASVPSFSTSIAPNVTTDVPSAIGSTTATITGLVNPGGANTTYVVWYGTSQTTLQTTSNFTYPSTGLPTAITGVTDTAVSVNLTGLTGGTQYYYRLVAKNATGTTFGGILSFMTTAAPTVSVQVPVAQSATSYQLVGTVNPGGAATSLLAFCYNTVNTASGCTQVALPNLAAGVTDVSVTATLNGLAASTTYYYWLIANNGISQVTSATSQTFTTGAPTAAPSLSGLVASGITNTAATTGATLNTGNLATNVYVCYSVSSDLSSCSYVLVGTYPAATSAGSTSYNFTGLTGGTKYYYSFKASNSLGVVYLGGNFTTSGSAIPLAISTTTLSPNTGTVGTAFSSTVSMTGGLGPFTWGTTGSVPTGLSINYATGVISGTPTIAGTYTFSVTLSDSTGAAVNRSYSVTIAAAAVPLAVRTVSADFPVATQNVAFSYTLRALGGSGTYSSWAIASGALPTGLNLNTSTGVISGTPSQLGDFTFTVRVTDSASATAVSTSLLLTVLPQPLTVTTSSLAIATESTAITSIQLTYSGGKPSVTWALAAGSTLPTGLTLTSAGVISGTPTAGLAAGNWPVAFVATDSLGTIATSAVITWQVIGAPTLNAATFTNISVGTTTATVSVDGNSGNASTDYSVCFTTSSAVTTANCPTWTIFGNDSNNADGIAQVATISGLTANTTYYYCFKAVNAAGSVAVCSPSATNGITSLTTSDAMSITTPSVAAGTVGTAYSQALVKAGSSTGTLVWTIQSGALPDGLVISSTTGAITGTPIVAGNFTFVVRVTDGAAQTADSASYTISVGAVATASSIGWTNVLTKSVTIQLQANPGNLLTTVYYCYGTVQADVNACTAWNLASVNGNGQISGLGTYQISQNITGLTPNTLYYFRFKLVNSATGAAGITTSNLKKARIPGRFYASATTGSNSFTTMAPLSMTPGTLSDGYTATAYSQTLVPAGGQGPYVFTKTAGNLPAGLSLATSGAITGIPTQVGSYTFTVTLTDSVSSDPAVVTYTILIGAVPTVVGLTESGITYATAQLNASVNSGNLSTTAYYCIGTNATTVASCTNWTAMAVVGAATFGQSVSAALSGLTAATTYSYRFKVVNAAGTAYTDVTSFTTGAAPVNLSITPANSGSALAGSSYSTTFTASGGTSPYTWSSTGTLPAGLTLSASGVLAGTPAAGTAGNYTITITVTDSANPAHSDSISWVLSIGAAPAATPAVTAVGLDHATLTITVDEGNLSTDVWYCLSSVSAADATACAHPISAAATLAPGSANPVIALAGLSNSTQYWVVAKAQNSSGAAVLSSPVSFTTQTPLAAITSGVQAAATVGTSYTLALTGQGGVVASSSYVWSVNASSTLPAGLAISGGSITGTPTAAGNYSFKVDLSDGVTTVTSSFITIDVIAAPTISSNGVTALLPNSANLSVAVNPGNASTTVTYCLVASLADVATCTYSSVASLTAGTLPVNEVKSVAGLTPNTQYWYSFKATNSVGTATLTTGTFTTPAALSVVTAGLGTWTANAANSATLVAAGGSGSYTAWALKSPSVLPAGLALDPITGVISGTPTTAGHYTFVVTVTDGSGATADSVSISIDVVQAPTIVSISSSGVTSSAATITAVVNPGNLATTVLYCYSTIASCSPATSAQVITAGTSNVTVNVSLTGLTASTVYYFNFSAGNSAVVSAVLATEASFTTAAPPTALSVTTSSLPSTIVGVSAYSQTLSRAAGTGTFTWSVSSGSLPAGLTLNPATGEISGNATTPGNYAFTVTVTDSNNVSASAALSIDVFSAPVVTETEVVSPTFHSGVTNGTVNSGYAATSVQVCYSKTSTDLSTCLHVDTTPATLVAGTSAIAVTATLGNLDAATVYYWRIVATNQYGTTLGVIKQFTTAAAPAPLVITTASSSNLLLNASLSLQFAATGGVLPYTSWAISSGSLPAGLTLTSGGLLSGSVAATGVYQFVVTVYDSYGNTQSLAYTLTVTAPATVTTGSASNVTYYTPTNNGATLSGTVNPGNVTTHVWFCYQADSGSHVATVANCQAVDAGNAQISGTTDVAVSVNIADLLPATTYYYVVVASNEPLDAHPVSGTIHSFTTTAAPAAMVIGTTSLPNGIAGNAYSNTLTVTNGTAGYTWAIASGSLPSGMSLGSTSGTISGTPAAAGTYTFTVRVTDVHGLTTTQTLTLVVIAAPTAATNAATAVTQSGATLNGTVNPGLDLTHASFCWGTDSALAGCTTEALNDLAAASSNQQVSAAITGLVAGTVYYFQVVAQNSVGAAVHGGIQSFTATVAGAISITNASLPGGTVGTAYSNTQLANTGGQSPFTWTATGLPAGLTISSSGLVSGTPTTAGTYTVVVTVTGANNVPVSQNFTVVVVAEPTVVSSAATSVGTTGALLNGVINSGNATTNYYFCYSTDQTLVGCTQTPTAVLSASTQNQNVSASISGLQASTTYYFKVVAWNVASGQAVREGNRLSLNTSAVSVAPAPSTPPAPPVTPPTPPKPKPLPPLVPITPISVPVTGQAPATVDGKSEATTVTPDPVASNVNVVGNNWTAAISGTDVSGTAIPLNADGNIVVQSGQYASTKGTGFMPNTEVHVYVFSSPVLLGIVMTDATGSFSASFPIPANLNLGQHTVQLDGYTPDGVVRSANLLVLVQQYVGKVVTARFYFDPNQASISKANAAAIAKLVKGIGAGYKDLKVGVVGFVYPYDTKKANATLSKQRANNVVALMKKLGLSGVFVAKGAGRTLPANKTARRVDVNLTYQVATTTN